MSQDPNNVFADSACPIPKVPPIKKLPVPPIVPPPPPPMQDCDTSPVIPPLPSISTITLDTHTINLNPVYVDGPGNLTLILIPGEDPSYYIDIDLTLHCPQIISQALLKLTHWSSFDFGYFQLVVTPIPGCDWLLDLDMWLPCVELEVRSQSFTYNDRLLGPTIDFRVDRDPTPDSCKWFLDLDLEIPFEYTDIVLVTNVCVVRDPASGHLTDIVVEYSTYRFYTKVVKSGFRCVTSPDSCCKHDGGSSGNIGIPTDCCDDPVPINLFLSLQSPDCAALDNVTVELTWQTGQLWSGLLQEPGISVDVAFYCDPASGDWMLLMGIMPAAVAATDVTCNPLEVLFDNVSVNDCNGIGGTYTIDAAVTP